MTYCVGIVVNAGVVMLSDTRTNAGVDNISTFHKLTIFENHGERALVLMAAGNLSITQSVVGILTENLTNPDVRNLNSAANMREAAGCVGDAIRETFARDGKHLSQFGIEFNVSMILGGQIKGDTPRLFNIYSAGNFVEATIDTCYFQIGEFKYGKPIIDRVIHSKVRIDQAVKCGLISMDSTMRSNLTVSPPIDVVIIRSDELRIGSHRVLEADDKYLQTIRTGWNEALNRGFIDLPDPDWVGS